MIADVVHEFARGASFEAVVTLPINVPDNYFEDWQALCQLRRAGNLTKQGLIGDLDFKWLGPREFVVSSNDTDKWPLGAAEFDVLFSSRQGRRIRTKKVTVEITHGATLD